MKNFDIHFVTTASDFIRIEAENSDEAEQKFLKLMEKSPDYILTLLKESIQYMAIEDVEVDEIVEV